MAEQPKNDPKAAIRFENAVDCSVVGGKVYGFDVAVEAINSPVTKIMGMEHYPSSSASFEANETADEPSPEVPKGRSMAAFPRLPRSMGRQNRA